MLRVGVIGAGAAGLAAARLVAAGADTFAPPVVFEQASEIGGTWVYTETTGKDKNGLPVHSSMYRNLRTNLPKEVMAYPDCPFRPDSYDGRSFIFHEEVLDYLHGYADRFDLLKYINFETHVERVTPLAEGDPQTGWKVIVRDLNTRELREHQFDAILVCNGHYSVPNVPNIPGSDEFGGSILHSHNYRTPEQFAGKRVILLGARASGIDISSEVSKVADKVYLAHNHPPLSSVMPANMEQVPGIERLEPGLAVLNDGRKVEVDALILCTGYQFVFPFLSPECGVRVADGRVQPLYKHIIHTGHPRLGFIGLPVTVVPFPLFHKQVEYFLASLSGRLQLPDRAAMEADTEADLARRADRGWPAHYAHVLGCLQWQYNDELADAAGADRLPDAVRELYAEVSAMRAKDMVGYKDMVFRITGAGTFVQLVADGDVGDRAGCL